MLQRRLRTSTPNDGCLKVGVGTHECKQRWGWDVHNLCVRRGTRAHPAVVLQPMEHKNAAHVSGAC